MNIIKIFLIILALSAPGAAMANYAAAEKAYLSKDYRTALELVSPLVNAGDEKAKLLMGMMYLNGSGVRASAARAFGLFRQAAESGNVDAQLLCGHMLNGMNITVSFGLGATVAPLDEMKFKFSGEPAPDLGVDRGFGADDVLSTSRLALSYFTAAAKQGNAEGAYEAAEIYLRGRWLKHEVDTAIQLFKQSAAAGNRKAQYVLGVIYSQGRIIPRDEEYALDQLLLAGGGGLFVGRSVGEFRSSPSSHYRDTSTPRLEHLSDDYPPWRYDQELDWRIRIYSKYHQRAVAGDLVAMFHLGIIHSVYGVYFSSEESQFCIDKAMGYALISIAGEKGLQQATSELPHIKKRLSDTERKQGQLVIDRFRKTGQLPKPTKQSCQGKIVAI